MKNIFKLMLLFLLVLPFQACSDDDEFTPPTLKVTPNNIAGIWELHEWSASDSDVPMVYVEFIRKDRKFKIYQKFDSMYTRVITGTYTLEEDDYKGIIIKGKYDNGTGKWNNDYIVEALYEGSMILVVDNDEPETHTYVRVEQLPAEIVDNILSADEADK